MIASSTKPNPATIEAIRWRGEGPDVPNATICELRIDAPALVQLTSLICVGIILVYAFVVALKAQDFDTSFAVLVSTSVIVSPVAWIFYLTLLLLPFAKLYKVRDWKTHGIIGLALLAPFVSQAVLPIFGAYSSFVIALLLVVPLGAVLLLIGGLHYEEKKAYKPHTIRPLTNISIVRTHDDWAN